MKRIALALLFLPTLLGSPTQAADPRFPPPDFETGYTQPATTFQEEREKGTPYLDLLFLISAMGLAAWLLHHRRNRGGLFVLGIVSLLYLGFYKEGCICPIGAIQNVALGLFDSSFAISIPTIAIFMAPLIFALIWGRVFCGSVCPLGAIQDLFYFRKARVPGWLEGSLGLIPFFYLGLAVYFALVHYRFIICEYDPFVSLFRFSGPMWRFAFGGGLLLIGLVIARPYCRYLCPYGALLSLLARWSSEPVRITREECTNCTLCDTSCPFEAIERPGDRAVMEPRVMAGVVVLAFVSVVGFTAGGYWATGGGAGGSLLGLWFGSVIGVKLVCSVFQGRRWEYETDSASCLSCGRCYEWCPNEREGMEELEEGYVAQP